LDMLSTSETLKESIRGKREELANVTIQLTFLEQRGLLTLLYGACAVFLNAVGWHVARDRLEQYTTMLRC